MAKISKLEKRNLLNKVKLATEKHFEDSFDIWKLSDQAVLDIVHASKLLILIELLDDKFGSGEAIRIVKGLKALLNQEGWKI